MSFYPHQEAHLQIAIKSRAVNRCSPRSLQGVAKKQRSERLVDRLVSDHVGQTLQENRTREGTTMMRKSPWLAIAEGHAAEGIQHL